MASNQESLDVLAFGAHPDDVELSCGGTLIKLAARGYRAGVVTLTRGELGTRGDQETRQKESEEASRIMRLTVNKMLDLGDGHLVVTPENRLALIREIRTHKPQIVFAPHWQVRHPDHGYASDLVSDACFFAGLKKIDSGQQPHRPAKVIYYPERFDFKPSFIVDISDSHATKLEAIRAYRSQFDNADKRLFGDEETNVSTSIFLEAIVARARQRGADIGVEYGEAFLVREPMRLDDPVAFFGPEYLKAFQ